MIAQKTCITSKCRPILLTSIAAMLLVSVFIWLRFSGEGTLPKLAVGDSVPLFKAPLGDGTTFDASDYVGKTSLVIFFYPKDNTPLCTQEACSFRDAYQQFVDAGAEVIGVSADTPASHKAFAEKHTLPFPIISDRDGHLRKLFGVPKLLGFLPGRVTYVIDRHGILKMSFNSSFTASGHVQRALELIENETGRSS